MTPLYKIPGLLLLPSSLLLLLLLAALLGPRRLRSLFLAAAIALLAFASIAPLSSGLLRQQEQQYAIPELQQPPDIIVVLGNGHVSNPKLPLAAQLYYPALVRVTQAVVLAGVYPQSKLIFTGYAGADSVSSAQINAELALSLGVSGERVTRLTQPRNTAEEALAVATVVDAAQSILLVTSASHMPRAMALFEAQGLRVTAYPTGHRIKLEKSRDWADWWPKAENWLLFETWLYEKLAAVRQQFL